MAVHKSHKEPKSWNTHTLMLSAKLKRDKINTGMMMPVFQPPCHRTPLEALLKNPAIQGQAEPKTSWKKSDLKIEVSNGMLQVQVCAAHLYVNTLQKC